MPINFELDGSKKVPVVSVAALAATALAASPGGHQTPNQPNNPPDTPRPENVRHVRDYSWANEHHLLARLEKEMRRQAAASRRRSRTHLTPAQIAAKEVTPAEFAAWSKVNVCEEGGNWHVAGSEYSGGLGISNVNWAHYGGTAFSPTAAGATPDEQIVVARRIQPNPPDQNGCGGGW